MPRLFARWLYFRFCFDDAPIVIYRKNWTTKAEGGQENLLLITTFIGALANGQSMSTYNDECLALDYDIDLSLLMDG